MVPKTKFINENKEDPLKAYAFTSMMEKVSEHAQISPELVKQYGQAAFKSWEERTGRPITNLFSLKPEDRSSNIYDILNIFRKSLDPIVLSVRKMDKIMCVASVSLEILFGK